MKITTSNELIKMVKRDGWMHIRTTGSHYHFKHPYKTGIVTIPHPKRNIAKGTVNSILKQAQLK